MKISLITKNQLTMRLVLACAMTAALSGFLNGPLYAQGDASAAYSLPQGVTVANATAGQLAKIVADAVAQQPERAAEIVAAVIKQLDAASADKATQIVAAVLAIPAVQNATQVQAVIHAAVSAQPAFAVPISVAAATAAPQLATEIAKAAVRAASDQAENIAAALAKVPGVDGEAVAQAVSSEVSTQDAQGSQAGQQDPNPGHNNANPANTSGGEISPS